MCPVYLNFCDFMAYCLLLLFNKSVINLTNRDFRFVNCFVVNITFLILNIENYKTSYAHIEN